MTLPTVEVDATAVRPGHLIPVDGITARIQYVEQAGRKRILHWISCDDGDAGSLPVRAGGVVLCIRTADWLAAQGGGRG